VRRPGKHGTADRLETLRQLRTIRPGGGVIAEISLLVDERGGRAVLKSFRHRGPLFRRTVGALLARREASAYRRLGQVPGIPRFRGRVGCDGILLEYVECAELDPLQSGPPAEFFRELRALLEQIRAQGVLHGDVCRNVRIDRSGRPWLMDFGASFVVRSWFGPLRDSVLSAGRQHDERAVAVLHLRNAPETLAQADREALSAPLPWQRTLAAGRRLVELMVATALARDRRRPS
jgi:hypothetical protein